MSAVRDPGRYAGLILSRAALSPLDWVLSLDAPGAPDLDLNPADLSGDPFYLAGNFGHLALPVLLVHGADDPVVPVTHAQDWAARLKQARLAEFPGARHDILNETVHREVPATIVEFVLAAG